MDFAKQRRFMETSKVLLDLASSEEAKELVKRIRNGKARLVKADGLCGSSAALLLAGMMSKRGNFPNMMVVMNDLDDAGYMYHDLTQMMGEGQVLFLPSSYKRAIKYGQKDSANEVLRTEVLTRLSELKIENGKLKIIVFLFSIISEGNTFIFNFQLSIFNLYKERCGYLGHQR